MGSPLWGKGMHLAQRLGAMHPATRSPALVQWLLGLLRRSGVELLLPVLLSRAGGLALGFPVRTVWVDPALLQRGFVWPVGHPVDSGIRCTLSLFFLRTRQNLGLAPTRHMR